MSPRNWSVRVQRDGLTIWQHDTTGVRVHARRLHAWWHVFVDDPRIQGERLDLQYEPSGRAAERAARNFMAQNTDGGEGVEA